MGDKNQDSEKVGAGWRELSEEVMSGMREWREGHPKATFREIETALDERLSRLRTQMLQDTALSSSQTDWSHRPRTERPTCPECGTPLVSRGQHTRHLQVDGGHEVALERTYGTCPKCKGGIFPPR